MRLNNKGTLFYNKDENAPNFYPNVDNNQGWLELGNLKGPGIKSYKKDGDIFTITFDDGEIQIPVIKGREIELKGEEDILYWRYVGDDDWKEIGPYKGEKGATGENADPADLVIPIEIEEQVELNEQSSINHIYYRTQNTQSPSIKFYVKFSKELGESVENFLSNLSNINKEIIERFKNTKDAQIVPTNKKIRKLLNTVKDIKPLDSGIYIPIIPI